MKKYVVLMVFFISILTSCSIDDAQSPEFSLEVMAIESVEMPEEFMHGHTYSIGVNYTKPNSCYQFNDFIYEINGHERTVAVVNTVYSGDNVNCTGEPQQVTVGFDFTVTGTQTYVFKFYQGENAQGLDQYYIVEVPVVEGRGNYDGKEEEK